MKVRFGSRYFLLAAFLVLFLFPQESRASDLINAKNVDFLVGFNNSDSTFVIRLYSPEAIAEAREILSLGNPMPSPKVLVGTVVRGTTSYNPDWRFYLAPMSIGFAEATIEICNATPEYVESHLYAFTRSLLPGRVWCPYAAFLIKEIGQ